MEREHGTARGYRQHRRLDEETCEPCRKAWRVYCDQFRPTSDRTLQPCGTEAAYRRHLRHEEPPCTACTAAATQADAERRRTRVTPPD